MVIVVPSASTVAITCFIAAFLTTTAAGSVGLPGRALGASRDLERRDQLVDRAAVGRKAHRATGQRRITAVEGRRERVDRGSNGCASSGPSFTRVCLQHDWIARLQRG